MSQHNAPSVHPYARTAKESPGQGTDSTGQGGHGQVTIPDPRQPGGYVFPPVPQHSATWPCPLCPDRPPPRRRRTGLVILPAPTADMSAYEARGRTWRYPVRVQPAELRAGMRIGRRVLVGPHAVNLAGQRVPVEHGDARWLCRCDCGRVQTVGVTNLTCASGLSCGCYNADRTRYLARQRAAASPERAA